MVDRYVMCVGDVAVAIERSPDRVRQLDPLLQPVRKPNGARRYDPAVVAAYIESRKVAG